VDRFLEDPLKYVCLLFCCAVTYAAGLVLAAAVGYGLKVTWVYRPDRLRWRFRPPDWYVAWKIRRSIRKGGK
jgi:hypothetical protein